MAGQPTGRPPLTCSGFRCSPPGQWLNRTSPVQVDVRHAISNSSGAHLRERSWSDEVSGRHCLRRLHRPDGPIDVANTVCMSTQLIDEYGRLPYPEHRAIIAPSVMHAPISDEPDFRESDASSTVVSSGLSQARTGAPGGMPAVLTQFLVRRHQYLSSSPVSVSVRFSHQAGACR